MARARSIKPGFFTNEQLAELPPLTRLLFAGLWTVADRDGRLEDRPKRIKAQVLPYDNGNIDKMLQSLHTAEFIHRYEVDNCKYIAIPSWNRHQNPHIKEPASSIPAPCQHSAGTVPEPDETGSGRALTLNPVTGTLNPEPEGVGLPPVVTMPPRKRPEPPTDEPLWERYWGVFVAAGLALNDADKMKTLRLFLCFDRETQEAAVLDAETKASNGTWPDEQKTQRPWNHLDNKPWTRVAQPRTLPRGDRDEPAALKILRREMGETA